MNKIRKSLVCPICGTKGSNISNKDTYKKYEYKDVTGFDIKRTYNCYCENCKKWYQVEYGNAKLRRYNPATDGTCLDDVKLFVSYKSEFDRSYRIISVEDIPMIIIEDDLYPKVIGEDKKNELIADHEKTKSLVNNIWMSRYR